MPREHRRRLRALAAAAASIIVAGSLAGCTTSGDAMRLHIDPHKPFVLAGVDDLTQIAKLTGPGAINDTASVGVAGTDLGSMTTIGDKTFFLFGDTFGDRDPDSYGGQGGFWRSNVSAYSTDDDPSDGITFDGWAPSDDIGLAVAMVEGKHEPDDTGEVTKIPTYGFSVDGALYIFYMSVRHWGDAGVWDANYSSLAKSADEGRTWSELTPRWPGGSNFIQVATAHVEDGGTEFVYFWAIPAGRFGGVQLMRVPATTRDVEDQSAYAYFVGTSPDGAPRWSSDMDAAATVVDGTVGELSVMWSTYLDRWVMTYSDAGNAYIREGITPWGPWGEPIELAAASEYPGLYAPFMNPRYVADGGRTIYFAMSLWGPYNVFWYSVHLDKA